MCFNTLLLSLYPNCLHQPTRPTYIYTRIRICMRCTWGRATFGLNLETRGRGGIVSAGRPAPPTETSSFYDGPNGPWPLFQAAPGARDCPRLCFKTGLFGGEIIPSCWFPLSLVACIYLEDQLLFRPLSRVVSITSPGQDAFTENSSIHHCIV